MKLKTKLRGFTLVEVTFAVVAMGAVFLVFGSSHMYLMERAESSYDRARDTRSVTSVLREVENAIRMAEEIEKSGDGVLQVSTRYFVDADDELETVVYWFQDKELRKAIAPEGGSFGKTEVLLSGVKEFRTFALKIEDPFDAADYDVPLTEGEDRDVDLSQKVVYKIKDLGDVDPDLAAAYNRSLEALEVDARSARKFVTVTPPLPSKNLSVQVDFTPLEAEKYLITYGNLLGDETKSHSSRLYFTPGQIVLEYWDANVLLENQVVAYDWGVGKSYTVGFQVFEGYLRFWANDGSSTQTLGKIETKTLDDKPVHLEARLGARARFDNLKVTYPLVDVCLTMTDPDGGADLVFNGGAVSRQP